MTEPLIYPLMFEPIFKDYPWGGRNLGEKLGRHIPDGVVAESWEIAAHPNGSTPVHNGPLAGLTLPQVQEKLGEALLGSRNWTALAADRVRPPCRVTVTLSVATSTAISSDFGSITTPWIDSPSENSTNC